jgi:hypothetical protein
MISIKGLLKDEQGLSMGEVLMVKFRQPSVNAKSAPHAKHTSNRTKLA